MLGRLALVGIGVVIAFALAYAIIQQLRVTKRNSIAAYLLCGLSVFTFSVIWGCIVAAPVEVGDEMAGRVATVDRPGMSCAERDRYIQNTFLVMILPALVGVRLALKPEPDNVSNAP